MSLLALQAVYACLFLQTGGHRTAERLALLACLWRECLLHVDRLADGFEVHVGDFMTRFDALVLMKDLLAKYPEAYIIKTNIKYPIH